MTDVEILNKAISKAKVNGWKPDFYIHTLSEVVLEGDWDCQPYYMNVICDHDFAKSFWGEMESRVDFYDGETYLTHLPAWKYHLQQMVIAKDPIKYLAEHI